jgi:hypothetical protein
MVRTAALTFMLLLAARGVAFAQENGGTSTTPPSTTNTGSSGATQQTPDTHAPITADTKFDIGTVRTIDAQHNLMVCDMPDGQVNYDVSGAQVFDAEGKPQGAASSLKPGDKVRVMYVINHGAKASEVKLMK